MKKKDRYLKGRKQCREVKRGNVDGEEGKRGRGGVGESGTIDNNKIKKQEREKERKKEGGRRNNSQLNLIIRF